MALPIYDSTAHEGTAHVDTTHDGTAYWAMISLYGLHFFCGTRLLQQLCFADALIPAHVARLEGLHIGGALVCQQALPLDPRNI